MVCKRLFLMGLVLLLSTAALRADPVYVPNFSPGDYYVEWYYGCAPTAAGSIFAYWDNNGLPNLIDGTVGDEDYATNVETAIASETHIKTFYEDPVVGDRGNTNADKEEDPGSSASYVDNCIADFMGTSRWSDENSPNGATSATFELTSGAAGDRSIGSGLRDFAAYRNYVAIVNVWEYPGVPGGDDLGTWEALVAEINAGRPVMFGVDTDADGMADHAVPVFGYDSATRQYYAYSEWGSDPFAPGYLGGVWTDFVATGPGVDWGVDGMIALSWNIARLSVEATDAEAGEVRWGCNPGTFTVRLSTPAAADLTIAYEVSGTATPGTDYTALSGSHTLAAGESSFELTVEVQDDASTPSPDNQEWSETVIVTLLPNDEGLFLLDEGAASATVMIEDNDSPMVTGAVSRDGSMVADAWIEVREGGAFRWNTKTCGWGAYALRAPAGTYTFTAYDPLDQDAVSYPEAVTVTTGANVSGIDFELPALYWINGTITRGGEPLVAGWVDILNQDRGDRFYDNAQSDGAGRFVLGPLKAGTHNAYGYDPLVANQERFPAQENAFTVGAGQTPQITIDLPNRYSLGGTIALNGRLVEGLWVDLYDSAGVFLDHLQTGPDGKYCFQLLFAGDYKVSFFDPDAVPGSLTKVDYADGAAVDLNTADQLNIDFNVTSMYSISGSVVQGGDGVCGVWVDVFTDGGEWRGNAQTDGQGDFRIGPLPDGTYTLCAYEPVTKDTYGYPELAKVELAGSVAIAGGDAVASPITLFDLYPVTGTLTQGGVGLSGVRLAMEGAGGESWGTALTDGSGNFSLGPVPAGTYYLLAYHPVCGEPCHYPEAVVVTDGAVTVNMQVPEN